MLSIPKNVLALSGCLLSVAAWSQTAPAAYDQKPEYVGGTTKMLQDLGRGTRYPPEALRARASGQVEITFVVAADGSVNEAKVQSSSSPLLNEAALQAVRGLGKFRPATLAGQPVPAPMTLPISFRMTTTTTQPAVPVVTTPPGPTQPQTSALVGSTAVYKIAAFRDSTWIFNTKTARVSQHYFTYDVAGQPRTHRLDVKTNGKLLSSVTWRYEYAKNGRLLTKANTDGRSRYVFSYDNAGQLAKVLHQMRVQEKWEIMAESRLERTPGDDGRPRLAFSLSTKRQEGLSSFGQTSYTLAADGSPVSSQVSSFNYKPLTYPTAYSFAYDTHPNPLYQLFASAGHPFEVEDSGPHNMLRKEQNERSFQAWTYTYDAQENPVSGIGRNAVGRPYHFLSYHYAKVIVPARAVVAGAAAGLTIFPNPATTKTTLTATGIGPGEASLRLYDATGQLQRQLTFTAPATDRAETELPVTGLAGGVYTVEVAGSSGTASGKLLVQ